MNRDNLTTFIFGDSHGIFSFRNLNRYCHVNNCSENGRTLHHIGTHGIDWRSKGVSPGMRIILQYGEIDCRCHVGRQLKIGRTLEDILDTLVKNYEKMILDNCLLIPNLYIVVASIPPPTRQSDYENTNGPLASDHPHPFVGTDEERLLYIRELNKRINNMCQCNNWRFLDYTSYYSDDDGFLKYFLSDYTVHIGEQHNQWILDTLNELR